jgi:hypothetical protein
MSQQPEQTRHGVEIDWARTLAGALAAVASAVVLSTLGAAGTLIGAAIGSVVATVGGAMFTQGISTSRRKLADAQSVAMKKVGVAQAEVRRAGRADDTAVQDSHLDHADEQLAEAKQELDDAATDAAPVGWRERLSRLPWKRIWISSAAVFLVAVLAITAFELVAGRSVSSITGGTDGGGTTIGKVTRDSGGRGGSGDQDDEQPSESPSTEPSEGATPSESTSPTEAPTESATPTETASPTEFASPTEEPSGSPTE